ncbi:hypothetical protein [Halorussus ruber]|uniref:hypothetical protein n=1 Tax=Halorussus ruber TaxID=1126238 RepID=UPI001091C72A|nr:hypothetical protein [Halorussus ruber]
MKGTTTSAGLTSVQTAISLLEILGILLPLVGVLMQVMIRVYLTEDHDLSYRRQIGSISFIMLALVILILSGGGFLTFMIQQPVTAPLTLPLIGFGLGLAFVVLAVFWVVGDVLDIIEPPSEQGFPPGADPDLAEQRDTSKAEPKTDFLEDK